MKIGFIAFYVLLISAFSACKKQNATTVGGGGNSQVTPKTYYVSANGSDGNNGLSETAAFKTPSKAASITRPGDIVLIMDGTYSSSFEITTSGTEDKYITYKAYPGAKPKIKNPDAKWQLLVVKASYIILDGLEVEGNNATLTYDGAYASYQHWASGERLYDEAGVYNCNGIVINGDASTGLTVNHITVRNCIIHDFSAAGIGSSLSDYITIEGNTVYNNAWYTQWACSGISIINPYNSDASTGYKIFVQDNICYNNKDLIPWIDLTPKRLSDGNGIIIDVNRSTVTTSNGAAQPYNGRTLVENNISFNNGGSGIHAYGSDHVDIINNTAYNNGTVVDYADIFAADASDINILNNIMYSKTGGQCNTTPSGGTVVVYDYNIYYNGLVNAQGAHDKIADPLFKNASTDGTLANFSLQNNSPAIDAGTQSIFAVKDILGNARPKNVTVDCGAYEMGY